MTGLLVKKVSLAAMCGIAGILNLQGSAPIEAIEADKVLRLLAHRGPDLQRSRTYGELTLFHSRLCIIDTSSQSDQPFESEDGNETLVFNGEIFNYREIGKDHNLRTTGDVEVLLKSLGSSGKGSLNKLNGFFAFAHYKLSEKTLLLARDRYGVKPLYYFSDGKKFAFASELMPLLTLTGPQRLNKDQLYTYFRLNYCAGRNTIFENIYRLMPGEFIEIRAGKLTRDYWYKLNDQPSKDNLYELLDDAVRLRLRADVPVGSFLSGGLDSSIISALAKKHKPDIHTFSIGFSDEKYFDETEYAETVARHINSHHHTFRLKEDDFLHHLGDFLGSVDEPFADSSAVNMYLLCMLARKHVKVALSGDGADELFKGYNKHRAVQLAGNSTNRIIAKALGALLKGEGSRGSLLGNKLRQIKKFEMLSRLPDVEKQKFLASISSHSDCMKLLRHDNSSIYFDSLFSAEKRFEGLGAEDAFDLQSVLADDMLVKGDRFSMRHGLELRNPFLDHRVVEFALRLPRHEKINNNAQKIIVRKEFGKLLPRQIISRGKKGFELPLKSWLTGALQSEVFNELLSEKAIDESGLFNYGMISSLKEQLHSASPGDSPARMWAIIVFMSWYNRFSRHILKEETAIA
jgi:asparagine synthase (glutamine-hydrolysing)